MEPACLPARLPASLSSTHPVCRPPFLSCRGRWATEAECCQPARAHSAGCTKAQPCWVASQYFPQRTCGLVQDDSICLRGWGAIETQEECCLPGAAHSEGCGSVAGAEVDA